MNIKELRISTSMTQKEFSEYLNIPVRTMQDWEQERRTPPAYVTELIEYKIKKEKKDEKRKDNIRRIKKLK